MGCTGSVVYPNDGHEKIKQANGVMPSIKNGNSNHLRGDYSQLQVAKHNRDKYVKQRQVKIFAAANEMSGRIIEEREMLSLGTRSRGTSRNTSRTPSPTNAKRGSIVPKDEKSGLMTPVVEDMHSRDSRRNTDFNNDEDDEELVLIQKKQKTKSPHKVKKKHKTNRAAKPKGKAKKHKKVKKDKAGKHGKGTINEPENVDSGMEDNQADDSEEEADENGNVSDNEDVDMVKNDISEKGEVPQERNIGKPPNSDKGGIVIKRADNNDSTEDINKPMDVDSPGVDESANVTNVESRI